MPKAKPTPLTSINEGTNQKLALKSVNFHLDLTLDFHLEVTRVDVMSREAGNWSSLFFFLSGFGGSGAGPEAEAVIAGLEDMAVVGIIPGRPLK